MRRMPTCRRKWSSSTTTISLPTPPELRDQALSHFHDLREVSPMPREHGTPDLDDPQLSFQLAQALPDLDFLHGLLRHRSETGRLKQLNQYLDDLHSAPAHHLSA